MNSKLVLVAFLVLATPSFAAEIGKSDARALLDNWLSAQNTGAFSSYADMYAAKFQGIKRSADRTSRYNHDTWLKDRKRMFKNKMSVSAGNIRIQAMESSAIVKFEQTWESNGYKDKGDKQLYLIIDNDQLKIAREEMLASKVLSVRGMTLDSTNFPFAFAMQEGIVLANTDVRVDLKKIKLKSKGVDHIASVPVDTAILPAAARSLLGMPVRLYSPEGVCESRINGFAVVSKKIPHFGEIQRWKEEKTPQKKIALNIYNEGLHHLVATTEKCSGDFAKDARLPESPIFVGMRADKKTAAMAQKSFKSLAAYKTDIKPYIKDGYEESIKTFAINLSGKTTKWVSMHVMAGSPFCGQEGNIIGILWKVEKDDKGEKLKFIQYIDNDLEYATDIDNDGYPEFLSRDSETRGVPHSFEFVPTGGSKKRDYNFRGSYDYDCPC